MSIGGTLLHRFVGSLLAIVLVASPVFAQPVRLEMRPHAGDTLRLRIEQQTELVGKLLGGSRDSSITIKSSIHMFARAVIQRSDESGATIMALTDSIRATGESRQDDLESLRGSIEGKRVYVRVLPDGSSELLSADAGTNAALRAMIAQMPATLPKGPVEVGATWNRVVSIPLEKGAGPQTVKTTFRLDSLSHDRQLAYISMRGTIVEERSTVAGSPVQRTSGDMRGSMTLDRRRGWITDSVATINISAVIQRPEESLEPPVTVLIRMTQKMQTQAVR